MYIPETSLFNLRICDCMNLDTWMPPTQYTTCISAPSSFWFLLCHLHTLSHSLKLWLHTSCHCAVADRPNACHHHSDHSPESLARLWELHHEPCGLTLELNTQQEKTLCCKCIPCWCIARANRERQVIPKLNNLVLVVLDTQIPTIEKSHSSPGTSKPTLSEGQGRSHGTSRASSKSGAARTHHEDTVATNEASTPQRRHLQPSKRRK